MRRVLIAVRVISAVLVIATGVLCGAVVVLQLTEAITSRLGY